MRKPLYFDGQDVGLENVEESIASLYGEVMSRFGDMTMGGVISGLNVTYASSLKLSVSAGSALTTTGEHVVVPATASVGYSFTDVGAFVVLRYADGGSTGRNEHPVTGELSPARTVDSYELAVVSTPVEGDVVLSTITAVSNAGVATLSTADRQAIGVKFGLGRLAVGQFDPSGSIRQHLNNFGTGTVTPTNPHGWAPADLGWRPDSTLPAHLLRSHDHHLRTYQDGSPFGPMKQMQTRSGLVTVSGSSTVKVQQLASGDEFVVNGVVIPTISPTTLTVTTGVYAGCFALVLDQYGTPTVKPFLYYGSTRVTVGVMPINMDQTAPFPSTPTKKLLVTVNGSSKYLSWDDGPLVYLEPPSNLTNGDGFYTLYGGLQAGSLTVWVDYSALPGSTCFDWVTVGNYPDDATRCVLGHIWWFPGYGALGYGDEGVGGKVLDVRPIGSIRLKHFDNNLKSLINKYVSELRRDGWAIGGAQGTSPGGTTFVVEGGVVYVDGARIPVPTTSLNLGASQNKWIYVNATGTIVASTTDPGITGGRYARCYFVRTAAGTGFTYIRDERNILPNMDTALNLGCDYLSSEDQQQMPRMVMDSGPYGSARSKYRGRTLLIESKGPSGFDTVRLYATHWSFKPYDMSDEAVEQVSGIEITTNCRWVPIDPSVDDETQTSVWQADDATHDASMWGFDGMGWYQNLKRREELTGRIRTWTDTDQQETGLSTWSSQPFVLDPENVSIALHPTEKTTSDGNIDIAERVPLGRAMTNVLCPQNLVRAWGVLNVTSVSISADKAEVSAHIICGMNIGRPIYVGDFKMGSTTSNMWKIPLLTRLLRKRDAKYGLVPDAAVVGINNSESVFGFATDIQPTAGDPSHPKVRLEDDGKATYILVKGPSKPEPDPNPDSLGPVELAFAFNFMVVGAAADEALPPPDAVLEEGAATTHIIGTSPAMPDSGWAHDRVPGIKGRVRLRPPGGDGGGVTIPTGDRPPVQLGDDNLTVTIPTGGGGGGGGRVVVRNLNPNTVRRNDIDDNSFDPDASGRGPLAPGGGRRPGRSRTERDQERESQPGLPRPPRGPGG